MRQVAREVVGDGVCEIVVLLVAAGILEWQHHEGEARKPARGWACSVLHGGQDGGAEDRHDGGEQWPPGSSSGRFGGSFGLRRFRFGLRYAGGGGRLARIGDPGHRPDEPVAAPRHSMDAARPRMIRVQRLAQGGHLHREVALLDRDARPDRIHDGLLRDELTLSLHENAQNGQRTRSQLDGCAVLAPEIAVRSEAEAFKPEAGADRDRVHLTLPGAIGLAVLAKLGWSTGG